MFEFYGYLVNRRSESLPPPQHWGIVLSKSKTSPTFNTRTVRGGKNKTDIVWKLTDWLTLSRSFDNPVFGAKAWKKSGHTSPEKMNHLTFRNVPCSGFRETSLPPRFRPSHPTPFFRWQSSITRSTDKNRFVPDMGPKRLVTESRIFSWMWRWLKQ